MKFKRLYLHTSEYSNLVNKYIISGTKLSKMLTIKLGRIFSKKVLIISYFTSLSKKELITLIDCKFSNSVKAKIKLTGTI